MKNYLTSDVNTIFIMLGHECNLQCKYCLQHDVSTVELNKTVNPEIYNYILETARNQMSTLQVQFYGGEPLVFWSTVTKFISEIERIGKPNNLVFTMITNGKLLDEEKVDYINEHFSSIIISWDGRNSKITRGYDIVEDKKDIIFKLKHFSFSGVLSSYNYIKDFLEDCEKVNCDYVENYNGHTLYFNVDDLLDVNMQNLDLKNFDLDKVYQQISDLCDEYFEYVKNGKSISMIRKNYIEGKINLVRGAIRNNHLKPTRDRCGNGYEVVNLDLEGNLYKCHNTNDKVGTIHDNLYTVLKNVVAMDKVETNSAICDKCPVQIMCMNGCPLVPQKSREEYYCPVMNVMNYPILELITNLGGAEDGKE